MRKICVIMIIVFIMVLQGCSNSKNDKEVVDTNKSDQQIDDEITEDNLSKEEKDDTNVLTPTQTVNNQEKSEQVVSDQADNDQSVNAEDSTDTAATDDIVLPLTVNESGEVMIQTVSGNKTYPFNSYIITSPDGECVVVDPSMMPSKDLVDLNPAAIISTHLHPDHTDARFWDSYDCEKLLYEKGELTTKDFKIYTIPSSHSGDSFGENSGNVIAVFEVAGLRIAHMGDIGQTKLTEEQLTALGEIDIAFMQFVNSYSNMFIENEKGFNLIEQLNPKVIIPTHFTKDSLPAIEEHYGTITEFDNLLMISEEDLPEKNLTVYRILNNHKYN